MGNKRKTDVHLGMPEYYRFYRENDGKVNRKKYGEIVTDYLKLVKSEILLKKSFKLPEGVGTISIKKYKPKLEFEDGKLINKLPVNIKATNDLWNSDPEAKASRILVRYRNKHTNGYVFHIKWYKGVFKHCGYYRFKAYRPFKRELVQKIKQGNFDSFLL